MNGLIILGVGAFIGTWWIFYRMISWEVRNSQTGKTNTEKVEAVFRQIWNGEECSRQAAWYRTVQRLKMGDFPIEMVTEAEYRLLFVQYGRDNNRRSHYTITSNGRLVHVTELGGRDEGPLEV